MSGARLRKFAVATALSIVWWVPAAPAEAVEINCVGPIQLCINGATPGDTVVIGAGVYAEALVLTKAVSLRGAGAGVTVIDATSLGLRPLTVQGPTIDASVVIEDLTLTGGDVSGGNVCFPAPTNCGGGMSVHDGAGPTIVDLSIERNRAYRGGGLYAEAGSPLVLDRVIVADNTSVLSGGGISSADELTLLDSTVVGNVSEFNVGGGIRVGGQPVPDPPNQLTIEGSTISGNRAGTLAGGINIVHGAGVYAFSSDVIVRRSEIAGNECLFECAGGGLYMASSFDDVTLLLDDVDVDDNVATERGGGAYVSGPVAVTMTGTDFTGNRGAQGGGASLATSAGYPLTVTDGTFVGNEVTPIGLSFDDGAGGGLFSRRCDGVFERLRLEGNRATDGGGLACSIGQLDLRAVDFVDNEASNEGGGARKGFVADGITMTDGRLVDNSATDGGGLWGAGTINLINVVASANTVTGNGGAVRAGGAVEMMDSTFRENITTKAILFSNEGGGAVHASGPIVIQDSIFTGNTASNAAGGAVLALDDLELVNVVASANSAGIGGVATASGANVAISGSHLTDNHAVEGLTSFGSPFGGSGGAVAAVDVASSAIISDSHFADNTARGSGFSVGGAVSARGELQVTDSQFLHNHADDSGGAVNANGPTQIDGTTFEDNDAAGGEGGAIRAFVGFDVLTIVESSFRTNTAELGGGAVAVVGAIDTQRSEFGHNESRSDQGGAVDATGNYEDSGSIYTSNRAFTDGGAIYSNSNLHLDGTIVVGNAAGGDGGGAYVNSSIFGTDAVLGTNVAEGDGGGVYGGFRLELARTRFLDNVAGGDGGGLWISRSGPIVDSSFVGNTAEGRGGGVFHDAVVGGPATPLSLDIGGTTIAENVAQGAGGGLAIGGPRPLNVLNTTFSGNSGVIADGVAALDAAPVSMQNVTFAAQPVAVSSGQATFTFGNTLVSGACVSGAVPSVSIGGNLETTGDTCGLTDPSDQVGVSGAPAILVPLANNGGLTETHALPTGSPAIDAGVAPCPAQDQRGTARADGLCDAGAYEVVKGRVGDFVWFDVDGDGLQDVGEPGLSDVSVELWTANGAGNPIEVVDTAVTDPAGAYLFENVAPGPHAVRFLLPAGFGFTTPNAGVDEGLDSDADQGTGFAAPVVVDEGADTLDIDAGAILEAIPGSKIVGEVEFEESDGDELEVEFKVRVKRNGMVRGWLEAEIDDDLELERSRPTSLFISGDWALAMGTGRLDVGPKVEWSLTVIDGKLSTPRGPDALRLIVWAEGDPGRVLYDSEPGAALLDRPTRVPDEGNIRIRY